MIEYHYKVNFSIEDEPQYSDWINRIVASEGFTSGEIAFIFCDDDFLLDINRKYLNHDTYTDIITFDYSLGKVISGDIFISTERVHDNARIFNVKYENELLRVMAHGVLHLSGYSDKSEEEKEEMRLKESEKIKMFHVEQ